MCKEWSQGIANLFVIPIFDMFAIHQHWERARHLRFAPTAIYGMNFEKWY
jgi:hypothetical protein